MFTKSMKKIFIVTGELSGDRLAAWYVKKLKNNTTEKYFFQGVGGDFLAAEGVGLYKRFEELNVVGVVEILRYLPKIFGLLSSITAYIVDQHFDEVILVDFPGFNLRLLKRLKRRNPQIKITYLSPPQLWCWGAWRVKTLRRYCDSIIVLYPFEVAWYQRRGVTAYWLGSPVCDFLAPYRAQSMNKRPLIALLPGSRRSEIEGLLPLFLKAADLMWRQDCSVRFILPIARSVSKEYLNAVVIKHKLQDVWKYVMCVTDEHEKFTVLAQCCAALSKPGTVTLELALLRIPTVVAFKTSWLTYFLARPLVRVSSMSLPNLLTRSTIFKDIIQYNCTPQVLATELLEIYNAFLYDQKRYQKSAALLDNVASQLTTKV
jgi:lipid-A-disaccharide synthase